MQNKPKAKQKDYTIRNTLTVGLFVGALIGFLIALLIGVFKISGDDSTSDWIVAATSVSAAFISFMAVVLVAQTLKATRDALLVTIETGSEQKRIGDLQTRAWLSYDYSEVRQHGNSNIIEIIPCVRNYGPTPAKNISLSCRAFKMLLPDYFLSEDDIFVELRDLPPEKGVKITTGVFELLDNFSVLIKVSWVYETMSSEKDGDDIFVLIKEIDGQIKAAPLTSSDFSILDEIYECYSQPIITKYLRDMLVETNSQLDSI